MTVLYTCFFSITINCYLLFVLVSYVSFTKYYQCKWFHFDLQYYNKLLQIATVKTLPTEQNEITLNDLNNERELRCVHTLNHTKQNNFTALQILVKHLHFLEIH